MPRLKLEQVSKSYGATKALQEGNLELEAGEIHVLIGSNGSGKSTLCKIVAGTISPDDGKLTIEGKEVTVSGPQAARSLGVGIFYQELSLSANRSVAENISLSNLPVKSGLFVDRKSLKQNAQKYIQPFEAVTGEGFTQDAIVGDLRSDQKQLVEIMKTLATESDILIFDEPTSALDRSQVETFFAQLKKLKEEGRSIIFISHRMDEIFEIGDKVTVIRDGKTVASSRIEDTNPDQVVELMAGEVVEMGQDKLPATSADANVVATIDQLTGVGFHNVSFELKSGEILGLGGLHGQGQSALLRAMFGITQITEGKFELEGASVERLGLRQLINRGCAYVSGDRRRDGLIPERSILENVSMVHALKNRQKLAFPGPLIKSVQPALNALNTKFAGIMNSVNSLSGGNQQKVVISRWLTEAPRLLLLDDPTKGIDLSAKAELFSLIRELASEGMAIILYSSEDSELLANADRILVFNNGSISRELIGEDCNRFNLYQAAYEAA